MAPITTVFLLVNIARLAYGGGNAVNEAITNVDQTYDQHMCQEIMKVDCSHRHTNHEDPIVQEHICGSDHITYADHCTFAQARCFFVLDKNNYDHHHNQYIDLTVLSHGQCVTTTIAPPTTATPTTHTTMKQTTPSLNVGGASTTSGSSGNTATSGVYSTGAPTMAPTDGSVGSHTTAAHETPIVATGHPSPAATVHTTSKPVAATTTPPEVTTMSMHDIMAEVFCKNLGYINCSSGFIIVCGSDGQFYPNRCELSKAACKNPSLQMVDSEQCNV